MAPEEGPKKRPSRLLLCACTFQDPFIRETAQRLNVIAELAAGLEFEAVRLMHELRLALAEREREPPKRA